MASVAIETTSLEILVEAALADSRIGMQLLNYLRVKNGKVAYPGNYHEGDINHYQQNAIAVAAATVQGNLA